MGSNDLSKEMLLKAIDNLFHQELGPMKIIISQEVADKIGIKFPSDFYGLNQKIK